MKSVRSFLCAVILGAGVAAAQSPIDDAPRPQPRGYWSTSAGDLAVVDALAKTADFALTHRGLNIPGAHENDPIARPFVTRGAGLQAAYFAGSWAVDTGVSYWLFRRHHEKLARAIEILAIADSAVFVVHDVRQLAGRRN